MVVVVVLLVLLIALGLVFTCCIVGVVDSVDVGVVDSGIVGVILFSFC